MADDLYERDFYLWTQAQAEALRARGRGGNSLDYEHLAEEVGDLGASERNTCFTVIQRILQHLYKLETSRSTEPRNHWRAEVRNFRADIEYKLTRSIRRLVENELDMLHLKGARMAQAAMDDHEPGAQVDMTRRWSLAEIMGEEHDPLERSLED